MRTPDSNVDFIVALRSVVGRSHVLTKEVATRRFRTGFRYGVGSALAVVRPGSLVELWRVTEICVGAKKIIIPQASNTGLTGGSTPNGADYDRDVVIVNTSRIAKVHIICSGKQVLCLGGVRLDQLERALRGVNRDPHSVISSSCIGASVIGGICNNSGGSLVRRGPAYTEMALFARVDEGGNLTLVNHLGIHLGEAPEEVLRRLEMREFSELDIEQNQTRLCADHDYVRRVRDIESTVPARFNADPRRLFEASGSAGRVMVFAARLDTFPRDRETRVFYVGTNDPSELGRTRRDILSSFKNLPVSGEYLHREAFDIAEDYGRDTFLAIRLLGAERLSLFFRFKAWLDDRGIPTDRLLQKVSRLLPNHLPARLKEYRNRFEHHLILRVADEGIAEAREYLSAALPRDLEFFECTADEGDRAFLHRFVVAGAAVRYRAVHRDEVEDVVALDFALRARDPGWFEPLPVHLHSQIDRTLVYAHLLCNVFHVDYLLRKGCDAEAVKEELLRLLDARGAECPAEHNVGHLYRAKPTVVDFYQSLDPTNTFNVGLGKTSRLARWK